MRFCPPYVCSCTARLLLALAVLCAAIVALGAPARAFAQEPAVDASPTPEFVVEWPTFPLPAAEEPTATSEPIVVEPTATPFPEPPTSTPELAPIQTELPTVELPTAAPAVTELPSNQWGAIITVQPVIPTVTPVLPSPTSTTEPTATITSTSTPSWLPPPAECYVKPGKAVMTLEVPFIHQVNDIEGADGNWACGPTSVAMVLAYYGKLDPWPAPKEVHTSGSMSTDDKLDGSIYAPYVTQVFTNSDHVYSKTASDPQGQQVAGLYGTICPTGLADWSLMKKVLEWHGLSSQHVALSFEGVKAALKRGHPVLIGNNLTASGHVLVAVGYTANNQLIVNDPYGNRFGSGYGSTDGQNLYYAWDCMRATNALEVIGVYPPPPTVTPTPGPTFTPTETPVATATVPATATKVVSPTRKSQVAGLSSQKPTTAPLPSATPTIHVETLVASSTAEVSGGRIGMGLGLLVLATFVFGAAGFWLFKFDRALNRPGDRRTIE